MSVWIFRNIIIRNPSLSGKALSDAFHYLMLVLFVCMQVSTRPGVDRNIENTSKIWKSYHWNFWRLFIPGCLHSCLFKQGSQVTCKQSLTSVLYCILSLDWNKLVIMSSKSFLPNLKIGHWGSLASGYIRWYLATTCIGWHCVPGI